MCLCSEEMPTEKGQFCGTDEENLLCSVTCSFCLRMVFHPVETVGLELLWYCNSKAPHLAIVLCCILLLLFVYVSQCKFLVGYLKKHPVEWASLLANVMGDFLKIRCAHTLLNQIVGKRSTVAALFLYYPNEFFLNFLYWFQSGVTALNRIPLAGGVLCKCGIQSSLLPSRKGNLCFNWWLKLCFTEMQCSI